MNGIAVHNGNLFLSYPFLKLNKVPSKRLELWSSRGISIKKYFDGQIHILFESIPEPTRKQLPAKHELIAELNLSKHDAKVDGYYNNLLFCTTQGYIKHIPAFKDKYPTLSSEKINAICKLFAAWQYIVDLTINERNRDTSGLYVAFNKIYPNKYKNYNCFANAKKKAVDNGAENVAVDSRLFTTPLNVKTINIVNHYWAASIISIGKKYSNKKVWEKLCSLCKEANETAPSLSWVDKYRQKLLKGNISVYESRMGKETALAKMQPYMSREKVKNIHSQWTFDGFNFAFWAGGNYRRYVMVKVMDANSKKIIGFGIGESENTTVIMTALRNAIINTGCLPLELLSDRHSFNKTGEALNFKEAIEAFGTKYTLTSNPQYNSISERYNQYLDSIYKDYYGYLGEGVKSKRANAHPKQEMIDDAAKNQLSHDEIILIGIKSVHEYNETILAKEGKSPNQLFEEGDKSHCFIVSLYDRVKILTSKLSYKVVRGQLNITRGLDKYEYQLPANLYSTYNNRKVTVRYEDLNEGVYLYDSTTDMFITELNQKPKIYGEKASQTDRDIELMNKNKGRIAGIKSQAKKELENITEKALEAHPDAYLLINRISTPKDVLQAFEQNANLKRMAEEHGVDITKVHIPVRKNEFENESLKPKQKINDSPFTDKNHVIRKISLKDLEQE